MIAALQVRIQKSGSDYIVKFKIWLFLKGNLARIAKDR